MPESQVDEFIKNNDISIAMLCIPRQSVDQLLTDFITVELRHIGISHTLILPENTVILLLKMFI